MRRCALVVCAILALCGSASPRKPHPAQMPDQFIIGRHTSFDFGPPNDYYELFIVSGTAMGSSIERITLTPAIDACTLPAKVETVSASLKQPISALLGGMNPCSISDKELHRELKRCKKCLVFSYADVAMQVQCGGQRRVIQSKILDRDMFDTMTAKTPKDTSWTMRLLSRLDDAVGPSVIEKPMPLFGYVGRSSTADPHSPLSVSLGEGNFDDLFPNAPDKVSSLYIDAEKPGPHPSVRLVSVEPFTPESFALPLYPGIAALAHVQGTVLVSFYVGTDGHPTGLTFEASSPLLRGGIIDAISQWSFRKKGSLQRVHATIAFDLNCPVRPVRSK
jgi:hypothetical protein